MKRLSFLGMFEVLLYPLLDRFGAREMVMDNEVAQMETITSSV